MAPIKFAADEIIAPHRHFLAGEMVEREIDLETRIAGIFGVGETLHDILQRGERLFGVALVAADIGDLLVERHRLEIKRIGDFMAAGMKLDILVAAAIASVYLFA